MAIAVSIVEDNQGTRDGLKALVSRTPGLRCVGTHASGEDALRGIPEEKPDVVLVDINLPGINGIECVVGLKERIPQAHILILTTYDQDDLIFESLRAGAHGFLLKNMPPNELMQAIIQVHEGGSPMSMRIARKVVKYFQGIEKPMPNVEMLTKREQEIVGLLAKGFLYKEIAEQLGISLNTVRVHLHTVYEKLHVHSRTQAVLKVFGSR
jgi:DNA-binding NarL/FixJ family response regulator